MAGPIRGRNVLAAVIPITNLKIAKKITKFNILSKDRTLSAQSNVAPTIITYDYDPLDRLKGATYSTGQVVAHSFSYAYDAVGNLTEINNCFSFGCPITSYVYDEANHLFDANGITYTWDNNGNLLSDGSNTYTYDYANRLSSITGPQSANYAYNGLGDRLSQTVDNTTTNYTLDLAAGLTQVLDDGSNTYLYGLGRVSQQNKSSTDYFLTDALGSVRQLTDASGAVTLTKSYTPFGEVLSTDGSGNTSYGFAGEWTDSTKMVYLRARYYAPHVGRFTTQDPFPGIYRQPATLHPYQYAANNPVLYTDPSGEFIPALILGGALLGAVGNYGYQVAQNRQAGMEWGDALSCVEMSDVVLWGALGAGAGALIGLAPAVLPWFQTASLNASIGAYGYLMTHPTAAGLLGAGFFVAGALDDAALLYGVISGNPQAQQDAMLAYQSAAADGQLPFADFAAGTQFFAKLFAKRGTTILIPNGSTIYLGSGSDRFIDFDPNKPTVLYSFDDIKDNIDDFNRRYPEEQYNRLFGLSNDEYDFDEVNIPFLWEVFKSGQPIHLASDPIKARSGSGFLDEIDLLEYWEKIFNFELPFRYDY